MNFKFSGPKKLIRESTPKGGELYSTCEEGKFSFSWLPGFIFDEPSLSRLQSEMVKYPEPSVQCIWLQWWSAKRFLKEIGMLKTKSISELNNLVAILISKSLREGNKQKSGRDKAAEIAAWIIYTSHCHEAAISKEGITISVKILEGLQDKLNPLVSTRLKNIKIAKGRGDPNILRFQTYIARDGRNNRSTSGWIEFAKSPKGKAAMKLIGDCGFLDDNEKIKNLITPKALKKRRIT